MTTMAQRAGVIPAIGGSLLVAFVASAWARTQRLPAIASFAPVTLPAKPVQVVLTQQEMVQTLRDGGLPVSAIAEIASVERKTVYSWLEGTQAKTDRAQRLEELFSVLTDADVPLDGLWRVWGRTLGSGATLRALLAARELDRVAIAAACAELKPVVERQVARAAMRKPVDAESRNPALADAPVADLG